MDGLKRGSGAFANGQTFQCHPAAAAAGVAVMSIFESDNIVATCAKRGAEVRFTESRINPTFESRLLRFISSCDKL